jgi:hypothetical protein
MLLADREERYGPNYVAVEEFLERLRGLSRSEAAAFRRAMLARLGAADGPAGLRAGGVAHAAIVQRTIRAAVAGGRRDAHGAVLTDSDAALRASGNALQGIGAYARDVAAAICVRDLVSDEDFAFFYGAWVGATAPSAETASER